VLGADLVRQRGVKMSQTVDGIEIHYVYNTRTRESADFKFKDWSD